MVIGRKTPPVIVYIDHTGRTHRVEKFAIGPRVDRLQGRLHGGIESFRIVSLAQRPAFVVDHNCLEQLGAHDRSDPSPSRMTTGPAFPVDHGYRRVRQLHLSGNTRQDNSNSIPIPLTELLTGGIVIQANDIARLLQNISIGIEFQNLPVFSLPFYDDGLNSQSTKFLSCRSSHIGFFDPSG